MQSNGGITTARQRPRASRSRRCSPARSAGRWAAPRSPASTGRRNLLCVDMGGTSFDLSLVVDGEPTVSTETELEGLPVLMPLVDIHTIGAGGGSLAWLEAGGLRVGPQSAGADPGPACYGRGGTQPTVTDANLFLGRLDPSYFLGGRMTLDHDAAERALVARSRPRSASTTTELAEGMLAIINANMAEAMRTITVEQGIDPRDFALVAFGGAGPMHAVLLARGARDRRGDRALEPGHVLGLGDAADRPAPRRRAELLPPARRARRRARSAGAFAALRDEADALLEREGVAAGRPLLRSARPTCATSGRSTRSTSPVADGRARSRRSTPRSTRRTASATGTRPRARRSSSSTSASPPSAIAADRGAGRAPAGRRRPAARAPRRRLRRGRARHAGAPARPTCSPAARYRRAGRDRGGRARPPSSRPGTGARSTTLGNMLITTRRADVTETVARPATGVVDPITTEIIRNAFISCAQDMNATLIRAPTPRSSTRARTARSRCSTSTATSSASRSGCRSSSATSRSASSSPPRCTAGRRSSPATSST